MSITCIYLMAWTDYLERRELEFQEISFKPLFVSLCAAKSLCWEDEESVKKPNRFDCLFFVMREEFCPDYIEKKSDGPLS
jgi:hypothetical protein